MPITFYSNPFGCGALGDIKLSTAEVGAQLSPEIIYPRKVDTNFLGANFEYLRVLAAKDDVND